ncbi:Hexose carrier protein [Mycena kentingensis (nom. inval.)]|nr:Hexose carrier protein [Mycena kentingensis (nom. inval.)]
MDSLFESRFRAKIDSFFSPNDAELVELRSLLAQPRAQLAELTQEISRLQEVLTRLEDQRVRLEVDLRLHESLLAPIRKIPEDLLQEIFLACLPVEHNAIIHPDHAPLLFGRVNRRWRWLSCSTPLLWRSAHVPSMADLDEVDYNNPHGPCRAAPPSDGVVHRGLVNSFRRWITLSANAPLMLSYVERRGFSPFVDPALSLDSAFAAEVTGHSSRLERLGVLGSESLIQTVMALEPAAAPQLKHLCCMIAMPVNNSIAFDFARAPIFRSRALTSIHVLCNLVDPLTFTCHWANLTELGLICFQGLTSPTSLDSTTGGLDQNGIREILARCPNLVRCELGITAMASQKTPTRPILLPRLEELFICVGYTSESSLDAAAFFGDLEAPCLRLLGLGQGNLVQIRPIEMRRTTSDKLVVYLTPQLVPLSLMIASLRALSRTTTLFLRPITDDILGVWQLDPSTSEELFNTLVDCPVLENLSISMSLGSSGLENLGFFEFLQAHTSLRTLKLFFVSGYTPEVEEQLMELTRGRIDLELMQRESVPPQKWKYDPIRGL